MTNLGAFEKLCDAREGGGYQGDDMMYEKFSQNSLLFDNIAYVCKKRKSRKTKRKKNLQVFNQIIPSWSSSSNYCYVKNCF